LARTEVRAGVAAVEVMRAERAHLGEPLALRPDLAEGALAQVAHRPLDLHAREEIAVGPDREARGAGPAQPVFRREARLLRKRSAELAHENRELLVVERVR